MNLVDSTPSNPPLIDPSPNPCDPCSCDGDFPIESDGGTVDSGGQAQVPPPRPPEC